MTIELEEANLPVIDFAKILGSGVAGDSDNGQVSRQEKRKLFNALRDVGFVYLENPGVSPTAVDDLFALSKQLFDKPESEKKSILGRMDRPRGPSQGWSSPARLSAHPETADMKEFFGVYRDEIGPKANQWPENSPDLRVNLNAFFNKCHEVLLVLLSALAESIGLEAGLFEPYINEKEHFCALLYYPGVPAESFKSRVRSATHTDYGCMTLLFNDDGEGLQVCDASGTFQYAPRRPNCAIVNIGDLLSRMFNGSLRSTKHRVIEPPPKLDADGHERPINDRYSIAFFGHFNPDLVIQPLDACCTEKMPRQYEPVVAGEHVKQRVKQLHTAGHSLTEKGTV
ncbi:hypothetical protein MMC27_008450 [Xylographa pallens]|nr:hypothetical protein [Xylographa pallens]